MALSPLSISLFCFTFIFSGALIGLYIRKMLPEHHLSDMTWDSIKIGTGLIATLTALVLGLLVSSAKGAFDTMSTEITQAGAKIILLDRILSLYGQEAQPVQKALSRCLSSGIELITPDNKHAPSGSAAFAQRAGLQDVHDMLRKLTPQNEHQRLIRDQAMGLLASLTETRWLVMSQLHESLPIPFLIILVLWLTVFFMCFGLLSEPNSTVVSVMFVCAVSVTGAIFLILEMNDPIGGLIKVSLEPLRFALEQVGR
jgi:hypothetical protein